MDEMKPIDHHELFKLLTPQQQKFINLYVEYNNATRAYKEAYNCETMKDSNIMKEASCLVSHPKIAPILFWKQTELQKRHNITLDKLFYMLLSNYYKAIEMGKISDANKALEIIAKHLGLNKIKGEKNFTFDQIEERLAILKEQQKKFDASE